MHRRAITSLMPAVLVTGLAMVFFPGCPAVDQGGKDSIPLPIAAAPTGDSLPNDAPQPGEKSSLKFVGDAAKAPSDQTPAAGQSKSAEKSGSTHPAASGAGDDQKPYPKKKDVDYEQRNGKIFVGWEKPKLAILLSGMLNGYIEPCGCTGLENQKGGLSRRHTLIRQLEAKQWPLVTLDLGGVVRRMGPQATIKYQRAIDALKTMGYQAVGFGIRDLQLPTEEMLVTLPAQGTSPYVSANVSSIFDEDFGLRAPYRIIRKAGFTLGVTGVLGSDRGKKLQNPDFIFTEPVEALPPVLEKLKAEKCDHLILLANSTIDEAQQLARQFPDFDYVVAAGDSDPPSNRLEPIAESSAKLIELSHKGMYVGVLGLFDGPGQRTRYQRVPLDGRFPDSDAMLAMMAAYQEQLKEQGFLKLGLRPNPHPQGRKFVGSETCGECHTDAYAVWKKTPHSHATASLVKLPIPRHHDPECLSCHVTGWEPQEYYPFVTGYQGLKETPLMRTNGCENCHGPGHDHVAAESGDVELDDDAIDALRASMRLTVEQARKNDCVRCHDLDNSPDFDFKTYWPEVAHEGKN